MEDDFLKLSKTFNAVRSILRVPALDPKYKVAVLASNQVHTHYYSSSPVYNIRVEIDYERVSLCFCRTTV